MKIIVIILIFSVLLSTVRDPLPGDLNGDGFVDVLDVVLMVDWILSGYDPSTADLEFADLSGDGFIDILDVVQLVEIILNPVSDPLDIDITSWVTNLDEAFEPLPTNIGMVVSEGEIDDLNIFFNSNPDSVGFSIDNGFIYLDYLHQDFHGIADYGIVASNDSGAADTAYSNIVINPVADVRLNVVNLLQYGSPVMDGIESTIMINDQEYTTMTGTISMQLPAGMYDLWAENAQTGVFMGDEAIDHIVIITPEGYVPIQDQALAQRHGGSIESNVEVGTQDMNLDLKKLKNVQFEDYVNMAYIWDTSAPPGTDQVNILNPNVYVDTTWHQYIEPIPETLANAQWVVENFFAELAEMSEISYAPQWVGLETPPEPDPEGETFFKINFDYTESQPGHHGELVNSETNIIYRGSVYSPSVNSKINLAAESAQAYSGARNDRPGGSATADLLDIDEEDIPHPSELYVNGTKLWANANEGFEFATPTALSNAVDENTGELNPNTSLSDFFGEEIVAKYSIKKVTK